MIRDIIVTSGARVYSVAVSMVALVLTARWLGPEGRGVAVVLITWVNLFSSVGYLSLGQVCLHRAGVDRDLAWLGEAVASLMVITIGVSAIGWMAAAGMWLWTGSTLFAGNDRMMMAIAFAGLPFLIWEQYNSALLTVIGRLNLYNLNQFAARTITLALLALTILVLGWGVKGFLIATLAGQMIVAAAGARLLIRQAGDRLRTDLPAIGRLIVNGAKLHLNAIGVLLFSSADILMIQYYRGPAEAGIFQFAGQIFSALLILPQAALLVLNGKVTTLGGAEFWQLHKRMMMVLMTAMTGAAALVWSLAPWLVPLVAGAKFTASAPVLQVLCIAALAATLNTMMGLQWILRGLFLQTSLMTLATGLANCLLNLFLVPRFGAMGAAWATVTGVLVIPFTANVLLALRIDRSWKRLT